MNKTGRIIKIISNQYTVDCQGQTMQAIAMGKLRQHHRPVVGDEVDLEFNESGVLIQAVHERRNALIRPPIANVDQAIIVMSTIAPEFSTTLIDRLLFLIQYEDITPLIVISKTDRTHDLSPYLPAFEDYLASGYELIDLHSRDGLARFKALLVNKISVLTGQSGAGKSTLLNRLITDLNLPTQEPSKALGRGKHTTRHVQLYPLEKGWIADTPGFSSLDFSTLDKKRFSQCILDFKPFLGQCKYNDCLHDAEPGCAIKAQVKAHGVSAVRYQHYLECLHLIKEEF